jgi:hypothetical protein
VVDATIWVIPGHLIYAEIPTRALRKTIDAALPAFARNANADLTRGYFHRWDRGHDLFIDVSATLQREGARSAFLHAGHIVLTDFPTKMGIPIPGFSASGLGKLLTDAGVPKGWLCLSASNTFFGVLAIADGSPLLSQALAGNLTMNAGTFFDTFVVGSAEVVLGMNPLPIKNPLMVVGGVERIAAGIKATWDTYTTHVEPLAFFGSTLGSALLGAAIAAAMASGDRFRAALQGGARSGFVGGMAAVNSYFAMGATLGFCAFSVGRVLAESHGRELGNFFRVDEQSVQRLYSVICEEHSNFEEFYTSLVIKQSYLALDTAGPVLSAAGPPHSLSDVGGLLLENRPVSYDTLAQVAESQLLSTYLGFGLRSLSSSSNVASVLPISAGADSSL